MRMKLPAADQLVERSVILSFSSHQGADSEYENESKSSIHLDKFVWVEMLMLRLIAEI